MRRDKNLMKFTSSTHFSADKNAKRNDKNYFHVKKFFRNVKKVDDYAKVNPLNNKFIRTYIG